jgi:GYF domain 2
MSEAWHYADDNGSIGPVSFEELRQALATRQNPRSVLVWCPRFRDWVRAQDVPELSGLFPPPLPPKAPPPLPPKAQQPSQPRRVSDATGEQPKWRIPGWWYVAGLFCLAGFSSIGNRVGRAEMGRVSELRRRARRERKQSRVDARVDPSVAKLEQLEKIVAEDTQPDETKKGSTFWLIVSIICSPVLWLIDATAMSNFWVARTPVLSENHIRTYW